MGMSDELICKLTIPGDVPQWIQEATFQTKSLDRTLELYTIDPDGYLLGPDGEIVHVHGWPYTGIVSFYTSNLVGSGPDGIRLGAGHTKTVWNRSCG